MLLGGVPASGLVPKMRLLLQAQLKVNLFVQKLLPSNCDKRFKELFATLYQVQIFKFACKYYKLSPAMLGCGEIQIIMEGDVHIVGLRIPETETGESLAAFTASIESKQATEIKAIAATPPNFELFGRSGDVLFLPSGFIFLTYAPRGTTGFRFSTSPPHDGEDKRVSATVAGTLDQYEALRDTMWSDWHDMLQSSV